MSELFQTFHIDWKLLVAQLVNFIIVLFVLYKFAYGPISKALNKRTDEIEKGLKDAKEARKKLEESTLKQEEILKKARLDAGQIIDKSQEQAKKNAEEIVKKAQTEAEKTLKRAKEEINQEKNKAAEDLRKEMGELVITAAEKIIGERLDDKKDKEIIEKVLE